MIERIPLLLIIYQDNPLSYHIVPVVCMDTEGMMCECHHCSQPILGEILVTVGVVAHVEPESW